MKIHIIEENVVINTVEVASLEKAQTLFPTSVCIPATIGGNGWEWDGVSLNPPATDIHTVMEEKKQYLVQINNDDNKIYADAIGNKATEYLKAAEDARTFRGAGYPTNDVPDYVQSWADAKQWTATQACDDILAQEVAWQYAAKLIREYRLKAKESVKRSTTHEEVSVAMNTWNTFVTNIRSQLGI